MALEEIEPAEAAAYATNIFLEVSVNLLRCVSQLTYKEDRPTSTVPKMSIAPFTLHVHVRH